MEIDKKYNWLYDEMKGLKEKINFRDRIEYRVNGKIHNEVGPAIIRKYDPLHLTTPPNDCEEFYINGGKVELDQWVIYNRMYKLKKIKKSIKNKKEND